MREDCAEGLRFAEQRGFAVNRHLFESAIDLATFDESPFAGLVEALQADGIQFLSLADVDMDPGYLRQLYEVNYRAVSDDPGSTGGFVSFEDFEEILLSASWFDPPGCRAFDRSVLLRSRRRVFHRTAIGVGPVRRRRLPGGARGEGERHVVHAVVFSPRGSSSIAPA